MTTGNGRHVDIRKRSRPIQTGQISGDLTPARSSRGKQARGGSRWCFFLRCATRDGGFAISGEFVCCVVLFPHLRSSHLWVQLLKIPEHNWGLSTQQHLYWHHYFENWKNEEWDRIRNASDYALLEYGAQHKLSH